MPGAAACRARRADTHGSGPAVPAGTTGALEAHPSDHRPERACPRRTLRLAGWAPQRQGAAGLVFLRARVHVAPSTRGAAARQRVTPATNRRDRASSSVTGVPSGATDAVDAGPSRYALRRACGGEGKRTRSASLAKTGSTSTTLRRDDRDHGSDDDSRSNPRPSGPGRRRSRTQNRTLDARPGNRPREGVADLWESLAAFGRRAR
jgi:hypothetical protein